MTTGQLPSTYHIDPIPHGRQLRSNYVYNIRWTELDFSDLLSLLWRYDQAAETEQTKLAAYYRAAWTGLSKALMINITDIGKWILKAQPPVMPALPAFVERQAPFSKDLMARAGIVTNLFGLRESVLVFGSDEIFAWIDQSDAEQIQDATLHSLINELYRRQLPTHIDELSKLLALIDDLLYAMLLPWHPRKCETLPNLIAHYGFPDPSTHVDEFSL